MAAPCEHAPAGPSYRLTVRGRLSARFAGVFGRLRLEPGRPGETVLVGELRDSAELYGVIERLRDLGLELVRLERQP
jgi:hypothetical protein